MNGNINVYVMESLAIETVVESARSDMYSSKITVLFHNLGFRVINSVRQSCLNYWDGREKMGAQRVNQIECEKKESQV
jgi:hypothetical protein